MSYDGGGKPGIGVGLQARKLNGMLFAVTRATKRVACNVSQQRVGTGKTVAMNAVTPIGHEAAPTFFWGG